MKEVICIRCWTPCVEETLCYDPGEHDLLVRNRIGGQRPGCKNQIAIEKTPGSNQRAKNAEIEA